MRNNTRWGWILLVAIMAGGCGEPAGVDERASQAGQQYPPLPTVPKVLIVGDSISMQGGYFPGVVERLGDRYDVVHNPGNGSDSANVLAHLEAWVSAAEPDIIHFNCGLHDLKFDREKHTNQQPPDVYERNLRQIVAWLKANTQARLMFALTTPVNEQWHHANKPFDRRVADVDAYNAIARKVMSEAGIPIDDLHRVIANADPDTCLKQDGVHMNAKGNPLLADAVAGAIERLAGRSSK
jgi:lysophospholipase L1-like esterase